MHRLFVALRPPSDIRRRCLAAMEEGPRNWAWQSEDQLHVTLRYIGEVERPVAEDIAVSLGTVSAPPASLRLSGVGYFDQGRHGALFARVGPREPLTALHMKIDRLLVRHGLEPERRAYLPHITLARHRRGAADPSDWLEQQSALTSEAEPVDAFILYESILGRHGAQYEVVERYPLRA